MILELGCFGLQTTYPFLLGFLVGMGNFNLLTSDLETQESECMESYPAPSSKGHGVILAFFSFNGVTPDLTSALRVHWATLVSLSSNYGK